MVQLNVASEILNVVNFALLDIILLPYILFLSSRLAGYANHAALNKRGAVKLTEYKLPAIGGGLVMSPGWYRRLLLAIRLAVLVFVAVANLGIEGRTVADVVTRQGEIRVPGVFDQTEEGFMNSLAEQIECNEIVDDEFIFGSVIDGKCFPKVREYVSIHEMSGSFVERNISLDHCVVTSKSCKRTMYRCERVDLICNGLVKETGCDNSRGIVPDSCAAVLYDDDDEGGLFCNSGNLVAGTDVHLNQCRHFLARREDIVHWNDTYDVQSDFFDMGMVSVFASAYADRQQRNITLSEGERIVTEISLLWIIPALMTVAVGIILTVVVLVKCATGSKAVAHDERGLMKMLGKPVELVRLEDDDNIVPNEGGCIVYQ